MRCQNIVYDVPPFYLRLSTTSPVDGYFPLHMPFCSCPSNSTTMSASPLPYSHLKFKDAKILLEMCRHLGEFAFQPRRRGRQVQLLRHASGRSNLLNLFNIHQIRPSLSLLLGASTALDLCNSTAHPLRSVGSRQSPPKLIASILLLFGLVSYERSPISPR
jgi:hypothetical protein